MPSLGARAFHGSALAASTADAVTRHLQSNEATGRDCVRLAQGYSSSSSAGTRPSNLSKRKGSLCYRLEGLKAPKLLQLAKKLQTAVEWGRLSLYNKRNIHHVDDDSSCRTADGFASVA